jgi:hypothetical protein
MNIDAFDIEWRFDDLSQTIHKALDITNEEHREIFNRLYNANRWPLRQSELFRNGWRSSDAPFFVLVRRTDMA